MTTERDIHNQIRYAEKKGREEGRVEGRAEGEEKRNLENAKNFKKLGVAVETIAQATGLTVEQVEAL